MGAKPVIGVTPGYNYDSNKMYINNAYMEGIVNAGGIPIVLPLTLKDDIILEAYDLCNGILVSGGPDVDAKYFGEFNLEFGGDVSPFRDYMEIFLIKNAIKDNKPIFGICRGVQIMNIALGGTIYQDISSQVCREVKIKHSQTAPAWYPTHDVEITRDSWVWKAFKHDKVSVNSYHHQAIKDVADGFNVTSRARDGIIESIEHSVNKFAVGVQWHPEIMWEKNDEFLKLFKLFVEQC